MWLQNEEIRTLQQSIREKKRFLLSRILHDVLKEPAASESTPSHCPVCKQALVPKAFPYLEFFVRVCPNQHGMWMSEEVCSKMRGFVADQIEAIARRQSYRKLALLVASVVLALNVLAQIPNPVTRMLKQRAQMMEYSRISMTFWPDRVSSSYYPLPIKGSPMETGELVYFHQLLLVLNDGISNRMNMDDVLKTRKSQEEFWRLYDFYRERQSGVVSQLEQMEVPEKLKLVHEKIVQAVHQQISFYEQFTDARIQDPKLELKDFLENRELQRSSTALHQAFDKIRELYPSFDQASLLAIESRLCWLDII